MMVAGCRARRLNGATGERWSLAWRGARLQRQAIVGNQTTQHRAD